MVRAIHIRLPRRVRAFIGEGDWGGGAEGEDWPGGNVVCNRVLAAADIFFHGEEAGQVQGLVDWWVFPLAAGAPLRKASSDLACHMMVEGRLLRSRPAA